MHIMITQKTEGIRYAYHLNFATSIQIYLPLSYASKYTLSSKVVKFYVCGCIEHLTKTLMFFMPFSLFLHEIEQNIQK